MILIKELVNKVEEDVKSYWKYIHSNPELSMVEYETSNFIEKIIKEKTNVDNIRRVGETGFVIEIKGTKPGVQKTIALRADMDALPIQENTNLSYRSSKSNVMHACGHDVHTSIMIGIVRILDEIKSQFSGKVLCFFQPGEEVLRGAKLFLEDNLINFDEIDGIAALHVSPEIPAGTIGVKKGPILASTDGININIKGKQGHGAHPHTVVDPILIASHVVVAMQSLVSREIAPGDSAVVSFGKICGGSANNIVPNVVEIKGTLRTLSQATRKRLQKSIIRVSKCVAESMRGEAEVVIEHGTPPLICEEEWVDRLIKVSKNILGKDNVIVMSAASMGGEDFALMKEKVPGVFYRLGVRTPNGPYGSMHSPTYYTDENSFYAGMASMVGLVLDFLEAEYKI